MEVAFAVQECGKRSLYARLYIASRQKKWNTTRVKENDRRRNWILTFQTRKQPTPLIANLQKTAKTVVNDDLRFTAETCSRECPRDPLTSKALSLDTALSLNFLAFEGTAMLLVQAASHHASSACFAFERRNDV